MAAPNVAVNPKKRWDQEEEARALRAFLRRQGVPLGRIAAVKGCRASYLSDLLACDRRPKAASRQAYDTLWEIAFRLLREREHHV